MNRGQSYGRAQTPGSQLYLQDLVNNTPEYLNQLIIARGISLATYARQEPRWVSPLAKEDYKEYRDDEFLRPINLAFLYRQLHDFWPRTGPQWDALATVKGKDGTNGVIIVEAKANIPELGGPTYACGAESPKSLDKIKQSFTSVKIALGVTLDADWMGDYYQYANRLAHLYFLHVICQVPTWLVYICFIGGGKVSSPSSAEGWQNELNRRRETLGLRKEHMLTQQIIDIFPEVQR